jgi:hypothetical protein
MECVEALVFDVFGTVVDWHGSVTRELNALGDTHATAGSITYFTLCPLLIPV